MDGFAAYEESVDEAWEHHAGVETATPSPKEAYESYPDERIERPAYWDELSWS